MRRKSSPSADYLDLMNVSQAMPEDYLTAIAVKEYEDGISISGSKHAKARTFSNDGSFAGAWLFCVPKKGDMKMDNTSFRTALMLRLGVPFHDRPRTCNCNGLKIVDEHVDHLLCCKQNYGEIKGRHDVSLRHQAFSQQRGPPVHRCKTWRAKKQSIMMTTRLLIAAFEVCMRSPCIVANPTGQSFLKC